jgi:hypothetical protein
MRYLSAVSAAALLWNAATAFAADPLGRYTVEGNNPGGGGRYTGTVTVEKTGETYRVIWVVAGTRYIGTGIGDKNLIAVSYKSGSDTGLALYGADGGNWAGVWTYAGGRKAGPKSGSANRRGKPSDAALHERLPVISLPPGRGLFYALLPLSQAC